MFMAESMMGASMIEAPTGICGYGEGSEALRRLVEVVYPGGILAGDFTLLFLGAVRQNLIYDLPAPGEGWTLDGDSQSPRGDCPLL